MFLKNQPNVYTSSIYLLIYLKFLSLFPKSLTGPLSKGNFTTKTRDKIFSVLVIIAAQLMFLNMRREEGMMTAVVKKVWDLSAYMGKWTLVFLVCYQYRKRDRILEILKMINEFDEKAKFLKIITNFNVHRQQSLVYILITVVGVFIVSFFAVFLTWIYKTIDTDLITLISLYLVTFYCNAVIFQFSYFTVIIKDRLNQIHDKVTSKRILTNLEVDFVIELYEKVIKILDFVNENCTTQLVPVFGYLLMNVTFSLYGIVAILSNVYGQHLTNFLFVLSWFVEHAGEICESQVGLGQVELSQVDSSQVRKNQVDASQVG